MMMVPPMILSLPFKILVFVYLGGYTKSSILCLKLWVKHDVYNLRFMYN